MKKYWVYIHTTPDGMVYVGYSGAKTTSGRWNKSCYKQSSLWSYIEKFGWCNIKHEIVKDGLTKEDALQLEEDLIEKYKEKGICINKNKSNCSLCDDEKMKSYQKEYRDKNKEKMQKYLSEHKEHIKELQRKWYLKKKGSLN